MRYLDSETCGLHSMMVLLQYADDDGPITLYHIWKEPIHKTLKLIEEICQLEICGFNLAFDWFHICKIYTIFSLCEKDWIPEEHIPEIAKLESRGRFGPCVKPKSALDLMLHARKGPFQSLMNRKEIRIRKVPTVLAPFLAEKLTNDLTVDDIYFSRRKDGGQWELSDRDDEPEFKDIVLKFGASGKLKTLAFYALKHEDIIKYSDIDVPEQYWPEEKGWKPFGSDWPNKINYHINHWFSRSDAQKYASNDIIYTRDLHKYFNSPPAGDDDSVLACCVAACRWRGYAIDIEGIVELRERAIKICNSAPKAPSEVKLYIMEVLSEIELVAIKGSTAKGVLEEIADWVDHPAAARAQAVLDARSAKKEIELYDKLLDAGRFHASFVIIGTFSSRMAGTDQLNPQAIKRGPEVRSKFLLADLGLLLSGGDFDSFEVVLADAAYDDPTLRKELLSGKKIHALFAQELFPEFSYEEIMKTKNEVDSPYDKGKKGVFAIIYGGTDETMVTRLGVEKEHAEKAYRNFILKHQNIGKERQKVFDMFCSMRQPKGIGTKVEWHTPADYIESLLGFRRYFTLENTICKMLFELAQNPPKEWRNIKVKVVRRDRQQTASGAVQSALYAAAFNIQASNMRAAANHVIQSTGAEITKHVQREIWDVQPVGISIWIVQPMNVHDEILTPTHPDHTEEVQQVVEQSVESFRHRIPLIKMEWKPCLKNWAEK